MSPSPQTGSQLDVIEAECWEIGLSKKYTYNNEYDQKHETFHIPANIKNERRGNIIHIPINRKFRKKRKNS